MLTVLIYLDYRGLDREARRLHMDPAEVPAADLQDLLADVRCGGHADGVDEGLVEVEAEQVAVVFAILAERGVVGVEAEDRTVVRDPDQQGPALPAVQERGDGLEGCRLERLEELAGVRTRAERGFVFQVRS